MPVCLRIFIFFMYTVILCKVCFSVNKDYYYYWKYFRELILAITRYLCVFITSAISQWSLLYSNCSSSIYLLNLRMPLCRDSKYPVVYYSIDLQRRVRVFLPSISSRAPDRYGSPINHAMEVIKSSPWIGHPYSSGRGWCFQFGPRLRRLERAFSTRLIELSFLTSSRGSSGVPAEEPHPDPAASSSSHVAVISRL